MISLLALLAALTATPATLPSVVAGAKGGDTIKLAPGSYGWPDVFDRAWSPALVIDATEADLARLRVRRTSGLTVIGGRWSGAPDMAVEIAASSGITLRGPTFTNSFRGIAIGGSTDVRIDTPTLIALRSDGIDITSSHRVTVSDGLCADFQAKPPAHPDCIQGWSIVGQKPSSDITIERMVIRGRMQGIWFGDPAKGGVDRLTVRGNDVRSAYVNGIGLFACRDCVVEDNRVATWPGAPARSILRIKDSTVREQGNVVEP